MGTTTGKTKLKPSQVVVREINAEGVSLPPKTYRKMGNVSDGHHTFDELYEHRCSLFVALLLSNPSRSWIALHHADGTMDPDCFIAGLKTVEGMVTYHMQTEPYYKLLMGSGIRIMDKAPEWDGATAADSVKRLQAWASSLSLWPLRTSPDNLIENERSELVPATPSPFYGLRKVCSCGDKFWTERGYQAHYALEHIVEGIKAL